MIKLIYLDIDNHILIIDVILGININFIKLLEMISNKFLVNTIKFNLKYFYICYKNVDYDKLIFITKSLKLNKLIINITLELKYNEFNISSFDYCLKTLIILNELDFDIYSIFIDEFIEKIINFLNITNNNKSIILIYFLAIFSEKKDLIAILELIKKKSLLIVIKKLLYNSDYLLKEVIIYYINDLLKLFISNKNYMDLIKELEYILYNI